MATIEPIDVITGPIIYFDEVPNFGIYGGIGKICLTASRSRLAADGSVNTDHVVVADLRCNPVALLALKSAIEGILLLGTTKPEETKN